MVSSNLLMQYQSECLEALKSAAKVSKPFEKVLMDTLKLFMAIPSKFNFLQMGRYGEFSEQTYRNNFENETFDWSAFNEHLIRKTLTGKFWSSRSIPVFFPSHSNTSSRLPYGILMKRIGLSGKFTSALQPDPTSY